MGISYGWHAFYNLLSFRNKFTLPDVRLTIWGDAIKYLSFVFLSHFVGS